MKISVWVGFSALLIVGLLFASCQGERAAEPQSAGKSPKTWDRADATRQYQLMQTELTLADSGKPYLVIHAPRQALQIRLKGAVVWECKLQPSDDVKAVETFLHSFYGEDESLVRMVSEKYLFGAQEKSPDSVLAVVSGALGINQDLLQREIPSRFQIHWTNKLILDVSTDVAAKPASKFKNTMLQVTQMLSRPFLDAHLHVKMDRDKAITFWRALQPGMHTLIVL